MKLPIKISTTLNIEGKVVKLVLRKAQSESNLHIFLKLLSFIYLVLQGEQPKKITIEPKYRFRNFKPDLLVLKKSSNPKLVEPIIDTWVECKKVKLAKLTKLVRYLPDANIFWFHLKKHLSNILTIRNLKKFKRLDKVISIGIELDKGKNAIDELIFSYQPKWKIRVLKDQGKEIQIQLLGEFHNLKIKFTQLNI